MITCRDCQQEFTKPATRGRPPVRCENCRNNNAPKPVSIKPLTDPPGRQFLLGNGTVVSERVEASEQPKRKTRDYKSGFCKPNHDETIHRLCSGSAAGIICNCNCHAA